MASIQKRDGKYRVQISRKGVRKNATFKTKAEAQQWAYEEESRIDEIAKTGQVAIVFSDVLKRYQKEVSPLKKTASHEIRRIDRIIDEPIANLYIDSITKEDVNEWIISRLNTGVKESSVKRELTILNNVFTYAVEKWNYINKKPTIGILSLKSNKARDQRFTQDELNLLAERSGYLRSLDKPRARCVGALFFAIETAMRASEIQELTWDRVFFEKKIVYLPDTKNGSARNVPLSAEAIRILNRFKELKLDKSGSVFKLNEISNTFYKLKEILGLKHLNFHDSRREACSRLAKKVDVMTLAKISGHKDIKILLSTYYAPDMSEVAGLLD